MLSGVPGLGRRGLCGQPRHTCAAPVVEVQTRNSLERATLSTKRQLVESKARRLALTPQALPLVSFCPRLLLFPACLPLPPVVAPSLPVVPSCSPVLLIFPGSFPCPPFPPLLPFSPCLSSILPRGSPGLPIYFPFSPFLSPAIIPSPRCFPISPHLSPFPPHVSPFSPSFPIYMPFSPFLFLVISLSFFLSRCLSIFLYFYVFVLFMLFVISLSLVVLFLAFAGLARPFRCSYPREGPPPPPASKRAGGRRRSRRGGAASGPAAGL